MKDHTDIEPLDATELAGVIGGADDSRAALTRDLARIRRDPAVVRCLGIRPSNLAEWHDYMYSVHGF